MSDRVHLREVREKLDLSKLDLKKTVHFSLDSQECLGFRDRLDTQIELETQVYIIMSTNLVSLRPSLRQNFHQSMLQSMPQSILQNRYQSWHQNRPKQIENNQNKKCSQYMNLALFSILSWILMTLTSCATLEQWVDKSVGSSRAEKKIFSVQNTWVRSTPLKETLEYRRIHRFTPVIWKGSEGREYLIQGNGLDGVSAYNKNSGQLIWRFNVSEGVESGPVLFNDRLFFGGNDGNFYSISASQGTLNWTYPTRVEVLSEPLYHEGVLYVLTGQNIVLALNADTGKQIWVYVRQDSSNFSIRGGSTPAFSKGVIYVGFSDGYLLALDAKKGAVIWEKALNLNKKFRDLDSSPLIEGDFLYVMGYDDRVYCLRSQNGELVWSYDKGGYGSFLIIGDSLYFASTSGQMVALNKESGAEVWSYVLREGIATSPKSYKGMIVFGESQGGLQFLDALSGRRINSFYPGKGILSSPLVDEMDHQVFFISGEANLYSIEARWTWPQWFSYLK